MEDMNRNEEWLSCDQINEIDLVSYLQELGYQPRKIRNRDYWYLSPFRKERTASFKVNRKINCWYDHGLAEGGTLVDFGLKYHACTLSELLKMFNGNNAFFLQTTPKLEKFLPKEEKLMVKTVEPLTSVALLNYIETRGVDVSFAKIYCEQISYQVNDQNYYGIGFKNDDGGYEIRSPLFKCSSTPKTIRTFNHAKSEVAVFEGFMDFLTFLSLHPNERFEKDFLILNGVGLFERVDLL